MIIPIGNRQLSARCRDTPAMRLALGVLYYHCQPNATQIENPVDNDTGASIPQNCYQNSLEELCVQL